MNNKVKFAIVAVTAFVIGLSFNNFAMSGVPANYKVAVVDVQKVVSTSGQVKALKEEQTKKAQEIAKFVENARTVVNKEKDAAKKKTLEEQYNKEFQTKRMNLEKEYTKKLTAIDNSISSVINSKAKAAGYNLVLSKSIVLYGGTDITSDIEKSVK